MAAPQEPREKTTSRCAVETDRCVHVFEIHNYSLRKGLGTGRYIHSATFTVGRHDWRVRFYPDGDDPKDNSKDHVTVSIYLELMSKDSEVRALASFSLVDLATALPSLVCRMAASVFSDARPCLGVNFKTRSELEASPYLRDDRLVIQCDVNVITGIDSTERTDVTFKVKGEVFRAHKIVLATRSPVFDVELYGPVGEGNRETIPIEDMEPAIFKALLQYIYTDSLPGMDDLLDGDEREEMAKHLLVAADRYALERMKLMCESILCNGLKVENVAETLALADQHNSTELRDACIGFINDSSKIMDTVTESSGYKHLKRVCPDVFIDMWEKVAKSRRI
ncbi:unnamed protein product [Urochloa decumbens]|uniref:Uncharacterized protein n=1 Tax=Urochloa decumbens TaxID=240449 RepID=A0ABC9BV15_9POAL